MPHLYYINTGFFVAHIRPLESILYLNQRPLRFPRYYHYPHVRIEAVLSIPFHMEALCAIMDPANYELRIERSRYHQTSCSNDTNFGAQLPIRTGQLDFQTFLSTNLPARYEVRHDMPLTTGDAAHW